MHWWVSHTLPSLPTLPEPPTPAKPPKPREATMTTENILKTANTYPELAKAIMALIRYGKDRSRLEDLLATCNCTLDTDGCKCLPELS